MATRQIFGATRTSTAIGSEPHFTNPLHFFDWHGTEAVFAVPWRPAGCFCNFAITLPAAPGLGKSWTWTFRVNGVDSAMSITIADLATSGISTGNVVVAAGDVLSLKRTSVGSPTQAGQTHHLEFVSQAVGESGYADSYGTASAIRATAPPFSQGQWSASLYTIIYNLVAAPGSVTELDMLLRAAPGGGNGFTFLFVKNGVEQDGTGGTVDTRVVLGSADTRGLATFDLPVGGGDQLAIIAQVTGSPDVEAAHGVKFVADVDGESQYCGYTVNDPSTVAVEYNQPNAYDARSWDATEANNETPAGGLTPFTLRTLYVHLHNSGGGIGGYDISLRLNATSPSGIQSVSIPEDANPFATDADGSDLTGSVEVSYGDVLAMRATPNSPPDPAPQLAAWGMIQVCVSGACPGLTSTIPGDGGVIGPLVFLEFPRLVDDTALAEEPETPPTPSLPSPPSPDPDPPPDPPIPPDDPPPAISGTYGPIVEFEPSGAIAIAAGFDIQSVIDANPAGTTYFLQAGYYRNQTITPKNGDEIIGEFGAVMTGARVLTGWLYNGTSYYVTGQTQAGFVNGECAPGYPRCGHPEDVFFDDTPLRHVSSILNLVPGTFYFDYVADRIYIKDNPTGHVVETSVTANAIGGAATGVEIRNLVVEKYATTPQVAPVAPTGANWTIEQCEMRHNHGVGLRIAPGMTVHRSRLHHNGQMGIGGTGDGALIHENEIAYNNYAGVAYGWEAGGSKFVLTDGLTIRSNWFHHNKGPGAWCDINNINVVYEGNLVEDNDFSGIFHEISYDAIIRFNTLRRNGVGTWNGSNLFLVGWGIHVSASPNVQVYGNTLIDNGGGIAFMQQDRSEDPAVYGPHEVENFDAHDNVIQQATGPMAAGFQDVGDLTYFTSRNNTFEDHAYSGASCSAALWGWQNAMRTFPEWQAYGHDDTGSCS